MIIKHVLLIDDNEIDNYVSKYVLAQSKIAEKISVHISAIEALQYLKTLQNNPIEFPDIIFLDIQMPEMDGFGFLEELTKFPEFIIRKTSVFILTSSDDPDDKKRAAQYPLVKNYFSKPMRENILNEIR